MCRSEADKIIQNNGLVPFESGGKKSRAAIWISEKGSERSYQNLGKKGTHDVRVELTTNDEVKKSFLDNPDLSPLKRGTD